VFRLGWGGGLHVLLHCDLWCLHFGTGRLQSGKLAMGKRVMNQLDRKCMTGRLE
jgi:hypothetical protein